MLAFLRDSNISASVIQIINLLDKILGYKIFSQLFPVILTDNGSEFSNPKEIEKRENIPRNRTNVFNCGPSAPYQKGVCEVKHELICRILPKWSSFDDFTRKDIFLMMDHINSYKREKLNNCSPYETFSFYYREDVLRKLGCRPGQYEVVRLYRGSRGRCHSSAHVRSLPWRYSPACGSLPWRRLPHPASHR